MRIVALTAVWICLPAFADERVERAGVTLDFSLAAMDGGPLRAGSLAELRLAVHDTRLGQPVTGIHPSAFLLTRPPDARALDYPCQEKLRRRLVSHAHAGSRGEVNINSYLVLALNSDRTVSFVNPVVNYPAGKTENVVELPGDAYDWALTPDRKWLLVTIPSRRAVAMIDATYRRLDKLIQTGENGVPGRILAEPDGRRAWVGVDGGASLIALDLDRRTRAATLQAGPGRHELAIDSDGRFLYATNSGDDSVTVVETQKVEAVTQVAVPGAPGPVAFDPASAYFYVASVAGGELSAIDPSGHRVVRRVGLKPGAAAVAFPPEGRFAWIANPKAGLVTVIDTATLAVAAEYALSDEPAQVVFNDRFAYVYRRASGKLSAFRLAHIGKDAPAELAPLRAGTLPPQQPLPASRVAAVPAQPWIFFANGVGQTLLQADDGLRAPAAVGNSDRVPLAVLVLDRSLVETEPGIFRASLMLHWGGVFDVPVLVDNVQQCFRVEVEGSPDPEAAKKWPRIRAPRILNTEPLEARRDLRLRLALEDLSGRPILHIADFKVLIYERPNVHQQWIRPVHVGDGTYEAPVRFDAPGVYTVLVSSRSQGAALPVPVAQLTVQGGKQ